MVILIEDMKKYCNNQLINRPTPFQHACHIAGNTGPNILLQVTSTDISFMKLLQEGW